MHFPSLMGYRVESFFVNLLRLCKNALHEPELAQPVWAGRSSRADQYSSVVVRALEAIFTLWSRCQYFLYCCSLNVQYGNIYKPKYFMTKLNEWFIGLSV